MVSSQSQFHKDQFPIFSNQHGDKPLVYLDNAATTHMPQEVINSMIHYYQNNHSNVHRGAHSLGERATQAYEDARKKVKQFLNTKEENEIIFVKGTTEGINLVANAFLRPRLKKGDHILLTKMEHHSNIVPWQFLAQEKGAHILYIDVDAQGDLILDNLDTLLQQATFLAITHVSNVLGTVNPLKLIIEKAHQTGVPVLVDGAQAIANQPVNLQELDADFYVFSGHKIHAPMGIGVLYGKREYLETMSIYHGGGGMIETVDWQSSTYKDIPQKFEAGTPNVGGAVALHAALCFIENYHQSTSTEERNYLLSLAKEKLKTINKLKIIGNPKQQISLLSFIMENAHPHDIASILDSEGVMIRAGHHCAMPLMKALNVAATSRVSFGCFNDESDVDALVDGLKEVGRIFK